MERNRVLLEKKGEVALLVLNDPSVRNALSYEMAQAFEETLKALRHQEGVRCLVITGRGESFCSGGDFRSIIADFKLPAVELQPKLKDFYSKFLSLTSLSIPTIAAVNGHAVGAGFSLAMACDLRIAARDAVFHANFVRLGVHPGLGASYFLTKSLGPARALEILWLAEPIYAEEALSLGLVNRVVESNRLINEAMELAEKIASMPPTAVQMVKRSVYMWHDRHLEEVMERESYAQALCGETPEMERAIRDFLERKRK